MLKTASIPIANISSGTVEDKVRHQASRKMSCLVQPLANTIACDQYATIRANRMLMNGGTATRTHAGKPGMKFLRAIHSFNAL